MSDPVQVILSSNAGVILEYEGAKLLVDGIYSEKGHPFSNLGPDRKYRLFEGLPPYDHIDYLLFTHLHPDHFDPDLTLEYLKRRTVKGMFLPDVPELRDNPLLEFLRERHIPCVLLSAGTERSRFRVEPELEIRAFAALHLDRKFHDVAHYCYLIRCGEKNLLFTADVDYTSETFSRLEGLPLQAAFINPLFFSALRRGTFFKGRLEPQRFCIYHVPFAEDDAMQLRKSLRRDLAAWPDDMPPVTALTEPWQRLQL